MRPIDADLLWDVEEKKYKNAQGSCRAIYGAILDDIAAAPTITPTHSEPLTLEQLLEMEGEPVWVENLDVSGKSMWAIVQTWADDTLVMRGAHQCGCLVDRYSIGQRYRVCRCKPEGHQGRKHHGL